MINRRTALLGITGTLVASCVTAEASILEGFMKTSSTQPRILEDAMLEAYLNCQDGVEIDEILKISHNYKQEPSLDEVFSRKFKDMWSYEIDDHAQIELHEFNTQFNTDKNEIFTVVSSPYADELYFDLRIIEAMAVTKNIQRFVGSKKCILKKYEKS